MNSKPRHGNDIMPLTDDLKNTLRCRLLGTSGQFELNDESFELLWEMVENATWQYRQTAPRNRLDVDTTLDNAIQLATQCQKRLGMNGADFERLAFLMVRLCICAGFFGLYLDKWLLDDAFERASRDDAAER